MSGTLSLLPLYAFVTCTDTTYFPAYFSMQTVARNLNRSQSSSASGGVSEQTGGSRKRPPVSGSISCALHRHDMKVVKDFSWKSACRVVNLCLVLGTEN